MHRKLNQNGQIDPLVIPLVVSVVTIVGLAGFGLWSYVSYINQRDNVEQLTAEAVMLAEEAKAKELEIEFADREKAPHKTYLASNTVGSLLITYPKTWSGYIDETASSTPLDAFFHPDFVPESNDVSYALRVTVQEKDYSKEVAALQDEVEDGELTVQPITVSGENGLRFDGEIARDTFGAIVLLPLRDKTIRIWTESEVYVDDLTDIVLDNLTFEP